MTETGLKIVTRDSSGANALALPADAAPPPVWAPTDRAEVEALRQRAAEFLTRKAISVNKGGAVSLSADGARELLSIFRFNAQEQLAVRDRADFTRYMVKAQVLDESGQVIGDGVGLGIVGKAQLNSDQEHQRQMALAQGRALRNALKGFASLLGIVDLALSLHGHPKSEQRREKRPARHHMQRARRVEVEDAPF